MTNKLKRSERYCSECGARLVDSMTCNELLATVLGWESIDRELSKEHFFTVAAFCLQHPARFTADAHQILRSSFIEVFDNSISFEDLGKRMGTRFNGKRKVLKNHEEQNPTLKKWDLTIADVYHYGQSKNAGERVRQWSQYVRDQL
jgi:hypothetical protein